MAGMPFTEVGRCPCRLTLLLTKHLPPNRRGYKYAVAVGEGLCYPVYDEGDGDGN